LACLTYRALTLSNSTPTYFHAILIPYTTPWCLWLPSTVPLAEPQCRTVMDFRAFHASAPKEWNWLPLSLCSPNTLPSSLLFIVFQALGYQTAASSPGMHLTNRICSESHFGDTLHNSAILLISLQSSSLYSHIV